MHDWQFYAGGWTCSKCNAHISGRETAVRPASDTRVGTDQVPALKHLPIILDGDGDPVPMLSCEEVPVAIVMES